MMRFDYELRTRGCFDLYGHVALNVLFWLLCAVSIVAIMWHAGYIFGSEQYHMQYLAKGMPIPLMVDTAAGRFYPLTHCDCNFVLLLPRNLRPYTPQILYAANALIFLLTAVFVAKLTALEKPFEKRVVLLSFLAWVGFLSAPAVLLVSCWNSYPEQRMLFLMAVFAFAAFRCLESRSVAWLVCSFLSALLLFCYKESSFIVIGVFSATLLFGGWRRFDRFSRAFCATLLSLAVAYIVLYAVLVLGKTTASYQDGHKIGLAMALGAYLLQPEIAVAVVLASVRMVFLILGRSGRHLFWDALLFSGTAFVLAYVALQLKSPYRHYQCPAYAFLIPACLHWLLELARWRKVGWWIGLVLLVAFVFGNLRFTIPSIRSVLMRRNSEVPGLRVIAADPKICHVYYHHPISGYFEDHLLRTFSTYFSYAGGRVQIETVNDLKVELDSSEMEVVPIGFGNVDFSVFDSANMMRTEWYVIVRGPYHGPAPVRCGREGVTVHAGECGIMGLYAADGENALGGKKVRIKFAIDEEIRSKSLAAELVAGAVAFKCKGSIHVRANGRIVSMYDVGYSPELQKFEIPASCLTNQELVIEIESGEAVRPADCGWSPDKRLLGVNFKSLHIFPARNNSRE